MIERVGIIGAGHLASYLVEGLRRADPRVEIVLSPRSAERAADLAARFGARVAPDNQAVVDAASTVLLTIRPGDVVAACRGVAFRPGQVVISTAAGLSLAALRPVVGLATPVRAMPLSCAAVNRSPTLLYPDEAVARALFARLGQVHVLPDEERFAAASTIAAFYGWMYALLGTTVDWAVEAGVPPETARSLVLETAAGAAEVGLAYPQRGLADMLDSLATPGGITEQGLDVLRERGGLEAWTEALETVRRRLQL